MAWNFYAIFLEPTCDSHLCLTVTNRLQRHFSVTTQLVWNAQKDTTNDLSNICGQCPTLAVMPIIFTHVFRWVVLTNTSAVINKKSGCCTSQRSILGISWKDRITNVEVRARTGQQTLDNILRERDMSSVWTTSAYHSKHCTGRYQDTREDQVDQERTGGAWSAKTYERWGSPGRKQRWQLLTDTDGVGVWPNVDTGWIKVKVKRCHTLLSTHRVSSWRGVDVVTSLPWNFIIDNTEVTTDG